MRSPLLQPGGFRTFQSISGLVGRSKLGILAARHVAIAAQHGGLGRRTGEGGGAMSALVNNQAGQGFTGGPD